jgi:hypothetical protein
MNIISIEKTELTQEESVKDGADLLKQYVTKDASSSHVT